MSAASSSARAPTSTDSALRSYQIGGVSWLLSKREALLLWPMASGKTRTVLEALIRVRLVEGGPITIVATHKIVKGGVWQAEAARWSIPLTFSVVHGTPAQRRAALAAVADVYITTYDSLHTAEVQRLLGRGGTLVLDEISLLKKFGRRFKSLRKHTFTRRWGLTGTPASEHLLDLFYPVQLLDGGARFGKSFDSFRSRYFRAIDWNEYNWVIRPDGESQIFTALLGLVHRVDFSDLPPVVTDLIEVPLTASQKRVYAQFEKDFVVQLGGRDIVAAGAGVLGNKLRQICCGGMYDNNAEWIPMSDARFEAFDELIERLNEPVVVVYEFTPTKLALLQRKGFITLEDDDAIGRWNRGEVRGLVIHGRSGGHGLNLQYGGCHLVWFTLPWSAEIYTQVLHRLRRPGGGARIIEHVLYAPGTKEEEVAARLTQKHERERRLLDFAAAATHLMDRVEPCVSDLPRDHDEDE
jgi:SNF2 family DNA or RNA helicase